MKRKLKTGLTLVLAAVLLCLFTVSAYAADADADAGIMPCYENCEEANMHFSVANDTATFYASMVGTADTFMEAKLTVTIEKRFLGLFWNDVGEEWVGYTENPNGVIYGTMAVDGTGTYRANFKLIVYGNHGIADVIEQTIEYKYS